MAAPDWRVLFAWNPSVHEPELAVSGTRGRDSVGSHAISRELLQLAPLAPFAKFGTNSSNRCTIIERRSVLERRAVRRVDGMGLEWDFIPVDSSSDGVRLPRWQLSALFVSLGYLGVFSGAIDTRLEFYPVPIKVFPSDGKTLRLGLDREGRVWPHAGSNLPYYYLLGKGLRNEVRYVNVDRHRDWLLHDYRTARPVPRARGIGLTLGPGGIGFIPTLEHGLITWRLRRYISWS